MAVISPVEELRLSSSRALEKLAYPMMRDSGVSATIVTIPSGVRKPVRHFSVRLSMDSPSSNSSGSIPRYAACHDRTCTSAIPGESLMSASRMLMSVFIWITTRIRRGCKPSPASGLLESHCCGAFFLSMRTASYSLHTAARNRSSASFISFSALPIISLLGI